MMRRMALVAAGVALAGCAEVLRAGNPGVGHDFLIVLGGHESLYELGVASEKGESMWVVRVRPDEEFPFHLDTIDYGRVPAGMIQKVPEGTAAPAPISDGQVVWVDIRYHSKGVPPLMKQVTKRFRREWEFLVEVAP